MSAATTKILDAARAEKPTVSSLISKDGVRALMRKGWDTMQIAVLFKTTEACIWNALGDGHDS